MNEAEINAGLPATAQYRYADRLGDNLFVAGQVPLDSHGYLVGPQDPGAQALPCLRNLERLLAVHEFQITDIRQLVVYRQSEIKQVCLWHGQRSQVGLVGQVPPATLLGVARLGYVGQLVEIDTKIIKA